MEIKQKILNLLSTRNMTATDISMKLDKAPSTVCEHLSYLVFAGHIERVPNPYIKKWKYYRIIPVVREVKNQGVKKGL